MDVRIGTAGGPGAGVLAGVDPEGGSATVPLGAPVFATVPLGRSVINWKDGWTVEGGLAKPLTEKLLGIVSLQWDRAVGREVPERYSLLFNAKYKMTSQIDIDCGVGVAIRKGVKDASQNFMTAVVTYDLKGGADLILNTALTYSF